MDRPSRSEYGYYSQISDLVHEAGLVLGLNWPGLSAIVMATNINEKSQF